MGNPVRFEGRIRRSGYWRVGVLAIGIATMILHFLLFTLAANETTVASIVVAIIVIAVSIAGLSISVRRRHDLGVSAWWVLNTLTVPGLQAGDQGPNTHGPEPEGGLL